MYRGTTFESMSMSYTPFTIVITINQEEDDQHKNYISNT
jgi:hypothetical protein